MTADIIKLAGATRRHRKPKPPGGGPAPKWEDVPRILRQAAADIERQGLESFNTEETDSIRIGAWKVRDSIAYGESNVDYYGRPWTSVIDR
ncbi:MAG: hypothetical protein AB7S71_18265 [Dongiaceae bacterium]